MVIIIENNCIKIKRIPIMKKTTSFSCIKGTFIAVICSIVPTQAMWHNYTQDYLIEPTKKYIIKPIVKNPKTSIGIGLGLGTVGFLSYTYYKNTQQTKPDNSRVALQALARGYNERKNYEKTEQNVKKMTSILDPVKKGYNVRKEYQEMLNNHPIRLQSAARGFLAREEYKPNKASEITLEILERNNQPEYQIFQGKRLSKRNYLIADILHLINTKTNDILDEFRKQYKNQNFDRYFSNIAKIILSKSPLVALQNYDNKQLQRYGSQILYHIGRLLQPDLREKTPTKQLINGVWIVCDPDGYALTAPTLEELLNIKKWLLDEKTNKDTIIKHLTPEIYADIAQNIATKFMFNLGNSTQSLNSTYVSNYQVKAAHLITDFFPEGKNQENWYVHTCTYQYDEKKCDDFTLFINQHEELKSFFKTISNNQGDLSDIVMLKIPNTGAWAQSIHDYVKIKKRKDLTLNKIFDYKRPSHDECMKEATKKYRNSEYQVFSKNHVLKKYHVITDIICEIIKITHTIQDLLHNNYKNLTFDSYYLAASIVKLTPITKLKNNMIHADDYNDFLIKISSLLDNMTLQELSEVETYFSNKEINHLDIVLKTPGSEIAKNLSAIYKNDFIGKFARVAYSCKLKETRCELLNHRNNENTSIHWYTDITYTYNEKNTDDNLTNFIKSNDELTRFFKIISNNETSLENLVSLTTPDPEKSAQSCEEWLKINNNISKITL